MDKFLKSFRFAFNGFVVAWKEEFNFRIEIFVTVFVIFSIFYFDFGILESALLVFAIMFVLVSEIFNTVIEDLCNKIEPNIDPKIAKIKDLSSAAVLISSVGAMVIGVLVFLNHF